MTSGPDQSSIHPTTELIIIICRRRFYRKGDMVLVLLHQPPHWRRHACRHFLLLQTRLPRRRRHDEPLAHLATAPRATRHPRHHLLPRGSRLPVPRPAVQRLHLPLIQRPPSSSSSASASSSSSASSSGDRNPATIDPRMMRKRSIWAGGSFTFCLGPAFFVIIYYLPIWFQAVKDVSAYQSGIRNIPFLVTGVMGFVISGALVTQTGYYAPFMLASSALTAVGAGLLTTFDLETGHAKWIGYQVLVGFGRSPTAPDCHPGRPRHLGDSARDGAHVLPSALWRGGIRLRG